MMDDDDEQEEKNRGLGRVGFFCMSGGRRERTRDDTKEKGKAGS